MRQACAQAELERVVTGMKMRSGDQDFDSPERIGKTEEGKSLRGLFLSWRIRKLVQVVRSQEKVLAESWVCEFGVSGYLGEVIQLDSCRHVSPKRSGPEAQIW